VCSAALSWDDLFSPENQESPFSPLEKVCTGCGYIAYVVCALLMCIAVISFD
jgi:hypothetical protein